MAAQTAETDGRQEHSGPLDQPLQRLHHPGRASRPTRSLDPPGRCLGLQNMDSAFLAFFQNARRTQACEAMDQSGLDENRMLRRRGDPRIPFANRLRVIGLPVAAQRGLPARG